MKNLNKKITTPLIILGAVVCMLVVIFWNQLAGTFVGFVYDVFIKPPQRTFCLNTSDDYRCVTQKAIQEKDPAVCFYLDAGSNDRCTDEVIEAVNDVSVCQKIPQWGIRRDCLNRFK